MRVVSQDGKFDFPYEKCCIWLNGKSVILSPISEPDSNYTYGSYATQEKAMKAIEMLRNSYTGMPVIFKNGEMTDEVFDVFKKINMYGIIANVEKEQPKIEYINNVVFQFPKDEDVQV